MVRRADLERSEGGGDDRAATDGERDPVRHTVEGLMGDWKEACFCFEVCDVRAVITVLDDTMIKGLRIATLHFEFDTLTSSLTVRIMHLTPQLASKSSSWRTPTNGCQELSQSISMGMRLVRLSSALIYIPPYFH